MKTYLLKIATTADGLQAVQLIDTDTATDALAGLDVKHIDYEPQGSDTGSITIQLNTFRIVGIDGVDDMLHQLIEIREHQS